MTLWQVLGNRITVLCAVLLLGSCMTAYASGARAPQSAKAEVKLHTQAHVRGPQIYLGEIATIMADDADVRERLERVEVGRAALPGMSRQLTVGSITLRIRHARFSDGDVLIQAEADRVDVHTRAQTITADEIAQLVRGWYEEALVIPGDAELLVSVSSDDVVVGVGDVDMHLASGTIDWGRSLLTIEFSVDGNPAKRLQITANASVDQWVYVARANLDRGHVIQEADVAAERMVLSEPALEFAPGHMRTTRFVRSGTPLTEAVVEPIPQVFKGQRVRAEAGQGAVVVEIVGVAESDGWIGDEIVVRNESTGLRFHAEIIGPQRVRAVMN